LIGWPSPHNAGRIRGYTLEAIRLTQRALSGRIPLIGFSGAPFTLACYAIEGGASREFIKAKTLMYTEPAAWHDLMDRLATAVGHYLAAQVRAGADALQLFDSWVGALSPADYREFVLPHSAQGADPGPGGRTVPLIHFGTGTTGILPLLKEAGGDVIGVDWRCDLAEAWDRLGPEVAVQGNFDPAILFSTPAEIRRQAARILDRVRGRPGHIFNLGHGIMEHTPVDHVRAWWTLCTSTQTPTTDEHGWTDQSCSCKPIRVSIRVHPRLQFFT
jgi:uroporphyrinogen decarboxylase